MNNLLLIILVVVVYLASGGRIQEVYRVGNGKTDITGPVAYAVMSGYADLAHISSGLLNRLYCRAFVIEDYEGNSLALVHTDSHSIPLAVHEKVLEALTEKFGKIYSNQNVILHSQHTHSATNGAHTDLLWYYMLGVGFRKVYFDLLVDRIVEALSIAHYSKVKSKIYLSQDVLDNASKQRSPEAYAANPIEERKLYDSDKNKIMTILRIESIEGQGLSALLSFFPVHTTSFTQLNNMVNPDNKGYAQWFLERKYPGLVAAFFQTNHGDISPNLVDNKDGTFIGEGRTYVESAEKIGIRQAETAEKAIHGKLIEKLLSGKIASTAEYVDFANIKINESVSTCPAVIGVTALAGTEDGRGVSFIQEGWTMPQSRNSTFMSLKARITQFLVKGLFGTRDITPDVQQCQENKIPLITTGLSQPPLTPHILPLKVSRIGQFVFASLPFEATTMAGRRIQRDLNRFMEDELDIKNSVAEVLSLCNGYGGYLTTTEEYSKQHYEGASTHFGPNQLQATRYKLNELIKRLKFGCKSTCVDSAKPLKANTSQLLATPFTSKLLDATSPPSWMVYGKPVKDVLGKAFRRGEPVFVTYWCAFPANSQSGIVPSFCDVEQYNRKREKFDTFLRDDDWNVRFVWRRKYLYYSVCTCEWIIEKDTKMIPSGIYRLVLHGAYESPSGEIIEYNGTSSQFKVGGGIIQDAVHDISHYAAYIPDELLIFLGIVTFIIVSCLSRYYFRWKSLAL